MTKQKLPAISNTELAYAYQQFTYQGSQALQCEKCWPGCERWCQKHRTMAIKRDSMQPWEWYARISMKAFYVLLILFFPSSINASRPPCLPPFQSAHIPPFLPSCAIHKPAWFNCNTFPGTHGQLFCFVCFL